MRTPRTLVLTTAIALLGSSAAHAQLYEDDFARADGALDGWTVAAGTANILGGSMSVGPTAEEHWIWAGDPPFVVPAIAEDVAIEVLMEFIGPGSNAVVGRHAGAAFCVSEPTTRATFSGYTIDWIDRSANPDDRGIRLVRVDGGAQTVLGVQGSAVAPAEPPLVWRAELDDTNIRVYGDDVLYFDIADSTYRGGHAGVWTWLGDQEVLYDDFVIEGTVGAVAACFSFNPETPLAGSDVFFDAGCTISNNPIASYSWDMGDGTSLMGQVVEHTYAFADNYTVTLTVEDNGGATDEFSQIVGVAESLLPYSDDFDRAPGPVDGWTVSSGEWNITANGTVETVTGGAEHWLWAGDPPGNVSGDWVCEFELDFLTPGPAGVGRHGGIAFFCDQPTNRAQFSGYFLDWIDRASDHGFRCFRSDGGAHTPLDPGGQLDAPVDPPRNWRIEVSGSNIKAFGDGILLIDVEDDTYRSGHFGFWAWNEQHMAWDNLEIATSIDIELTSCLQVDAPPAVFPGDTVSFDGSCSRANEGAEITAYEWDFGDGNTATGPMVEHTYASSDIYTVTLTVRAGGESDESSTTVAVSGRVTSFSDDFDRADGPVGGWTVFNGNWALSGDALVNGPTLGEEWIFAGSPPVAAPGETTFTFDYEFLSFGGDVDIGRHGGFAFHTSQASNRAGFSGYVVDWIDRIGDRGIRIGRYDDGVETPLVSGQGELALPDPPLEWEIEVTGSMIRVSGDGVLIAEAQDSTYRGGFFGFWAFGGGQEVRADNVNVSGDSLVACFTSSPDSKAAGSEVSFDASCSLNIGGDIASYSWDFGDGNSGNGQMVTHTYDFADTYTVTLTIADGGGNSVTLDSSIVVADSLTPFADCFEGDIGPVTGWTPFAGEWNVTEGNTVETITGGVEHWLWAGDPPGLLSGDFVAELDVIFVAIPPDVVGRHGGISFFADQPTQRFGGFSSGYFLDWIDRPDDRGFRFFRVDGGVHVPLIVGQLDLAPLDPPERWRLEVAGATINFFGDDELVFSVEDDTHRSGHFGVWSYSNGQTMEFDTVQIGTTSLPECGDPPPPPPGQFKRGDADGIGVINLTDGVFLLNFLFLGGPPPPCMDAADVNDDGQLNITTGVFVFNWLFLGGPLPPAPGPAACGSDPTADDLGCAEYNNC